MAAQSFRTKTIQNRWGQTIRCKLIPEEDRPGRMDPRVLANYPAVPSDGVNIFSFAVPLETQRGAMGWDNHDLTAGSVTREQLTVDGLFGPIPVYLYRPAGGQDKKPGFLFFHGGGFFGGTCKCVENDCKLLAREADAIVLSVDYRLAPENPYPAGLQDCVDVLGWARRAGEAYGIDPQKPLGVGGDSAGGNFAATVSLRDRDLGWNAVGFQALLYPAVNLGGLPCEDAPWSEDEYEISPEHAPQIHSAIDLLAPHSDACIVPYYLGQRQELLRWKYISPLFASDLTDLPPTLIVNAEFDYLRLEGEAYGRRLAQAGVPVELLRYNGVDHAFIDKLGDYPQAEDCMMAVARAFRSALLR